MIIRLTERCRPRSANISIIGLEPVLLHSNPTKVLSFGFLACVQVFCMQLMIALFSLANPSRVASS